MADSPDQLDPLNVNGRLYHAISSLLDDFPDMSIREQIATVTAISRIQVTFIKLREEKVEPPNVGAAVKRYETAFAKNANRKRKAIAGNGKSSVVPILDEDDRDDLEY
jgi:hypothetical protein